MQKVTEKQLVLGATTALVGLAIRPRGPFGAFKGTLKVTAIEQVPHGTYTHTTGHETTGYAVVSGVLTTGEAIELTLPYIHWARVPRAEAINEAGTMGWRETSMRVLAL
jgi:hypothetical protein